MIRSSFWRLGSRFTSPYQDKRNNRFFQKLLILCRLFERMPLVELDDIHCPLLAVCQGRCGVSTLVGSLLAKMLHCYPTREAHVISEILIVSWSETVL
ncbi:hypothetical protein VTN02DRAFT_2863 [Thermoascus thermophilus]